MALGNWIGELKPDFSKFAKTAAVTPKATKRTSRKAAKKPAKRSRK